MIASNLIETLRLYDESKRREFEELIEELEPFISDCAAGMSRYNQERLACACQHVAWKVFLKMRPGRN